jgi:hypothetical protein
VVRPPSWTGVEAASEVHGSTVASPSHGVLNGGREAAATGGDGEKFRSLVHEAILALDRGVDLSGGDALDR